MTVAEAEQYLATVFRPLLVIHSSQAVYVEALRLCERYSLSWHDALIVAAAVEGESTLLLNEDLPHGQRFGDLRIQNPFL